ncbi:MAG TPA: glycosyl transferase family 2 [Sphingobacterium sp.]|uniref:glycosyltransferase n=1 Tax=Sphingobacterium multivorum TaxID=28454 RepID=UPI000E98920A|nr:glycosyltransferase [Sphingobacterium multivorum]HAU53115.1 glycosyl transferase family 2 [Sphingobacterium sp.]
MVTVAIPFYNAEKYLNKAIESVINQSYQDWTLLLIDDGSSDSSVDIAKKYAKIDKRIYLYVDGENKNLGYRLNQIPFLCNTEYLARMDADDIMHPERIKKQIETLILRTDIDVLGTNAYSIDENDIVVGIRSPLNNEKIFKVENFIHPTIMGKTEWFRQNPYDVEAIRVEDTELWFRTNKSNNFYSLSEPLLFYREFGSSYYKKYLLANSAKQYILKKYNKDSYWIIFFQKNRIKSFIYRFFNFFGLEGILIKHRNSVLFKNRSHYENFIR